MQITPVTTQIFRGQTQVQTQTKRVEISNPFLFNLDSSKKQMKRHDNIFRLTVSTLALAAVAGTLFKLRMRNIVPESIVEIADKKKGLNKIKFPNAAVFLKKKLLYPIKAALEGDEKYIYGDKLKSGLILTSENPADAQKVISAITEHAREIGILCNEMPPNLKKNGRIKWVYKAIDDAKKHYEESNGEYTIINIGNISNLANLKISKVKFTKVEEKLGEINKQTYPGVIWIGWTNEWNSLPYFYNNAPILITKLVD